MIYGFLVCSFIFLIPFGSSSVVIEETEPHFRLCSGLVSSSLTIGFMCLVLQCGPHGF